LYVLTETSSTRDVLFERLKLNEYLLFNLLSVNDTIN